MNFLGFFCMYYQKEISLKPFERGFHLISDIINKSINPWMNDIETGLLHIFIKHTSASIAINENADETVRQDMNSFFNKIVPENESYYTHTYEGPDDMPAHIKSSIIGSSITIPITNGKLNMGLWQGVYLCEHRNFGGSRTLVLTIIGG